MSHSHRNNPSCSEFLRLLCSEISVATTTAWREATQTTPHPLTPHHSHQSPHLDGLAVFPSASCSRAVIFGLNSVPHSCSHSLSHVSNRASGSTMPDTAGRRDRSPTDNLHLHLITAFRCVRPDASGLHLHLITAFRCLRLVASGPLCLGNLHTTNATCSVSPGPPNYLAVGGKSRMSGRGWGGSASEMQDGGTEEGHRCGNTAEVGPEAGAMVASGGGLG